MCGCNALIGVSLEITMENNSEGSEGNLSPVKDDVYYGSVARRRKCPPRRSEERYGTCSGKERQIRQKEIRILDQTEACSYSLLWVSLAAE